MTRKLAGRGDYVVGRLEAIWWTDKGPEVRDVKLEDLAEGRCVQMLHVGSYDKEPETVAVMEAFAEKAGCELHGRHHEIYISDPRRVPPERLTTILRTPARARKKESRLRRPSPFLAAARRGTLNSRLSERQYVGGAR